MALKSKDLNAVRQTVPVQEVQKEELARVNLNVPESVRVKWKIAATEQKISLSELIIKAMNAHLSK